MRLWNGFFRRALIIAAVVIFGGCDDRAASQHKDLAFEITDLKKETESRSYGGADLKLRGLVKLKVDASREGTMLLVLKRKITFKSSSISKEGEDAVLIRNGSGLIDSSIHFSSEEATSIGSELLFGTITWDTVGVIELQPASVSVK